MENSYQSKRSEKLLRIHKFLLILYQELQLYGKISQKTQNKQRVEIERRTSKDIQRIKGQNHKSASTCSTKEGR